MALGPQRSNPVPLIIFIVLFVFSTAAAVLLFIDLSKVREEMDKGFRQSDQNIVNRLVAEYTDNVGGLKVALQNASRKDHALEEGIQKYKRILGGDTQELQQEMERVNARMRAVLDGDGTPGPSDSTTLVGLIHVLEREKLSLQDQIDGLKRASESDRARLLGELKQVQENVKETRLLVDQRDAEIDRLTGELRDAQASAKTTSDSLRQNFDKRVLEMEAQIRERDQTILRQADEVNQLRERIRIFTAAKSATGEEAEYKPETDTADGKVILIDRETGVIVNIGRKHGVQRGLKFYVYSEKGDGTRINRGEISVTTVYPEISRAILLGDEDPLEVLHVDDIVVNVAFDPNKPKVFVADTTFDAAQKQAFREVLEEHGGILEDEPSARTDFLIVGSREGKYLKQAIELGAVIIRESALNELLGR